MMAPAAATTPAHVVAKSGAFDTTSLFVADKAAREQAGVDLANAAKKEGVEYFASIGLADALVVVSLFVPLPAPPKPPFLGAANFQLATGRGASAMAALWSRAVDGLACRHLGGVRGVQSCANNASRH